MQNQKLTVIILNLFLFNSCISRLNDYNDDRSAENAEGSKALVYRTHQNRRLESSEKS